MGMQDISYVQDFINAAREMGVRVGPGRGSAAAALSPMRSLSRTLIL